MSRRGTQIAEARMKSLVLVSSVFTLALASAAAANDSMATAGAGGLVFLTNEDIEMTSEDLRVGVDEVKVVYEFTNKSDKDQHVLVAFPMPDIKGDGDFMVNIPTEEDDNLFGFTTTFNGEPVEAELHQYVFASNTNIEYTDYLKDLGISLLPFGRATTEELNALSEDQHTELLAKGLVIPMEYDAGQGWTTDYVPVWTLRSAYSFEADFPAGETVVVEHKYTPSVGGTAGVAFLSPPYEGYDPAAEYLKKYCTDDGFLKSVKKTLSDEANPYSAPFTETWLSYIWSTGMNWAGPIKNFHLTIDKGKPDNLVSFCWDGEVKKTSPTTFEMEAQDFVPPWNRELEILILNHQEPQEEGSAG
jgi:hypothetical protein